MTHPLPGVAALAGLIALAPLTAQDAAPPRDVLRSALTEMTAIDGVNFRTLLVSDDAIMRSMRGQLPPGMGGEDVEVTGSWRAGLLHAKANFGADEVVRFGGRTMARTDGDWKIRTTTGADGAVLPFLFDPALFFEVLTAWPELEVATTESASYRGQDVMIIGVTVEGEAAIELARTGLFPPPPAGPSMMVHIGGGGAPPAGETTIDLAFYIDPATKLVHRIRIKAYQENPLVGMVQIQMNGGPGGEPEPEEASIEEMQETDADGAPVYKRGMRVRKLGDKLSLADFDVVLTDHGQATAPQLGDAERAYLRLDK